MGKIQQLAKTAGLKPLVMAGALLVFSAASIVGMSAAQAAPEAVKAGASAPGEPPHHHRFGRGPGGPGFLPLEGRGLDRFLDTVKATDAQRTQIKALAKSAQADLKPLQEANRGLHEQTLALLAQPQVDAAAAENLRQQSLASHDALSKRTLQLVLDVSKVLTPEQRAEFVAKVQKRHDRFKAHAAAHARAER